MIELQKTHHKHLKGLKSSHWWWNSDDYIAQGKVSLLAVAEVGLAFYVYYFWLIPNTLWPWVSIFSVFTVPPLLLRSEASIQRGLELLGTFTPSASDNNKRQRPKNDFKVIFGVGFIVVSVLLFIFMDVVKHSLVGQTEIIKTLIFGSISLLLGVFAFFIVMIVVGGFNVSVSAPSDAEAEAEAEAVTFTEKVVRALANIVISSSFPIALCILAVGIRIRSTLTLPHIKEGIAAFSHNWYETVLISNVRQPPALLPRAGEVDEMFVIDADKHPNGMFAMFWVLIYAGFALIYRWNIKANAWMWLPLAYLLRPVKWERHPLAPDNLPPDSRRKISAFWSNRYAIAALLVFCGVVLSYLLHPLFDSNIQIKLSSWAPLLVKYLPIDKVGIRYVLLCLFALSLVMNLYFAVKLKSDYYKILEEHDKHQKLPSDPDKSIELVFEADAKRFVRVRWFAVASFILFTYSVLLQFFILKWPDTVGKAIWSWLRNSL